MTMFLAQLLCAFTKVAKNTNSRIFMREEIMTLVFDTLNLR